MTENSKTSDVADRDRQGLEAAKEYICSCTVVMTTTLRDVPHGTGFAVSYWDDKFIVTARHVLDSVSDYKAIRVIPRSDKALVDVPKEHMPHEVIKGIYGPIAKTYPIEIDIIGCAYSNNIKDLIVFKLNQTTEIANLQFHELPDKPAFDVAENESVVLFGFPGETAVQVVDDTGQQGAGIFPYCDLRPVVAPPSEYREFDPNSHFAMEYELDDQTYNPHGMSGSALWRFPKGKQEGIWRASRIEVVGVLVSTHPDKKLLKGTFVKELYPLMSKA